MGRQAYNLLLWLLLPQVLLHLVWRSRRQPAYLEHVGERFGRYEIAPDQPLIWVHAVSVGETRAAEPLIKALKRKYPAHRILLTHMTPTGRETGVALFGNGVARCYLPYDFPFAVSAFLEHFKPACGVLLETEIWPNLIRACNHRNIPVYLANARLSEKSLRRYRRFKELAATALRGLTAIAAQSADDAARFHELGATTVNTIGNLKFDISPEPALIERGAVWRAQYGSRKVLLLASTREGEEELLLQALARNGSPETLMVMVPRHPQRFDEIAGLLTRLAIPFQRRSSNEAVVASTQVLLGDSMGEMVAYYAACDVAIICGSFLPFGAHNLIEACALGKPVVIGPHDYNFAEAVQLAVAGGAALQVGSTDEAVKTARELLDDDARMRRMSDAGRAFVGQHLGAAGRLVELIRPAGRSG